MATLEGSKAYQYVKFKGWNHRATEDQLILEFCPCCAKEWHCYMSFKPDSDGAWLCHVCGEKGNLYTLRTIEGDSMENVMSLQDAAQAQSGRQPSPIPNIEAAHAALMEEAEKPDAENTVLDYLVGTRGFTMAAVERFKLGLVNEYGKRWLLIPYLHNGVCVYAKFRTVPPDDKDFRGLAGRECPLFNGDVLRSDMEEVTFVEGEPDCIACVSAGIEDVVGVPGANIKKAAWIKRLDDLAPKKIYLLYDNDKVGQDAAQEIASRIGIDKCWNVVLPNELNGEKVKDINDFFRYGGTLEDLSVLKARAKQFSIDGIYSVTEVIEDLKDQLTKGTLGAKYKFYLPELNTLLGGAREGDVLGIMAEAKVGKTTLAMNLLDHLVQDYDEAGLLYCQEMAPISLVQKWVSYKTDVPHDDITVENVDSALTMALDYKADLLFGRTISSKYTDVFDTIRQARRRYGVKFVVFDNLQLLCRSMEHATQEVAVICRGFKNLAMELGIVIILIIQPHRVKEGEVVAARNANGSAEIEKIVDAMLCLHRNREGKVKAVDLEAVGGYFKCNENFGPQLFCRADLTRYAGGGTDTLWMYGSTSKVTSFPTDVKAAAAAMAGGVPDYNKVALAAEPELVEA